MQAKNNVSRASFSVFSSNALSRAALLLLVGCTLLPLSGCQRETAANATTPATPVAVKGASSAASIGLTPVTVGRTTVAWTPADGLQLAFDNVPVVRGSRLRVVAGEKTLLDAANAAVQISTWEAGSDGSQRATVTVTGNQATAHLAFSVLPGGDVTVAASCQTKDNAPGPATLHYAAGLISGSVAQGGTLMANVPSGSPLKRVVPVAPPKSTALGPETVLAPGFKELSLDTRLGRLSVAYTNGVGGEEATAPTVIDARSASEEWAKAFPVLRVGTPASGETLKPGSERTMTYSFAVRPNGVLPPKEVKNADAAKGYLTADAVAATDTKSPVSAVSKAVPPQSLSAGISSAKLPSPLLIPRPKRVYGPLPTPFVLNANTRIVTPDRATREDLRAAVLLKREILNRVGLNLSSTPASTAPPTNVILLGGAVPNPKIGALVTAKQTPTAPQKPEGYALAVRPNVVAITGRDSRGVYWGAQTFLQLLMKSNRGPLVYPLVIEDWPTLSVRAVHLFHGKDALPFHKDLIERVLSRFKMNALFLQVEQVRWKHDPSVAPSWAGTPEQLKQEIAFAREHQMTVYPLLQSYGHIGALLNTSKNKAFAEDPESPFALCFTNPQAVKYWEGFVNEANATFDAPGFHVGMDEVTHKGRGRFPFKSKPKTLPELYTGAAEHWKRFLWRRGKKTFIWADMALYQQEVAPSWGTAPTAADAAKIRAKLPKDIIIVDWQYGEHSKFPSLKQLKGAGFKNIMGATWYRPKNIPNFTKAAVAVGAQGMIQTTWCGYESNASILGTEHRKQFTAMVMAADYFWNGGEGPAPNKLPYDPAAVFTKCWNTPSAVAEVTAPPAPNNGGATGYVKEGVAGNTAPVSIAPVSSTVSVAPPLLGAGGAGIGSRGGIVYDLTGMGNVPLPDALGYGRDNAPVKMPQGPVRLADGALYRFGGRAVLLAGRLNPSGKPYPVRIPLPVPTNLPVQEVRLALTASHRAIPGTPLGTLRVLRQDGSERVIDLIYGQNIAAAEELTPLTDSDAPLLWRGKTGLGQPYLVRGLRFVNTERSPITSLTLTSVTADAAPLLLGMTIVTQTTK